LELNNHVMLLQLVIHQKLITAQSTTGCRTLCQVKCWLNDSKISSVQNAVALKRSTRMQLSFCEDDLPALYGGILHV
jgi:hypothetical protein